MTEKEKVIEALEACVLKDPDDSRDCKHCPRCNYGGFISNSCINGVMADALALLKAQEPIEPVVINGQYECGECRYELRRDADTYCPCCGRMVKWG